MCHYWRLNYNMQIINILKNQHRKHIKELLHIFVETCVEITIDYPQKNELYKFISYSSGSSDQVHGNSLISVFYHLHDI